MNQKQNTQASRTDELWKRFVGMFGGEAVARKFGDAPPAEWVAMIGQLNDYQLERGMRRLLASGKAHVPSLPEFRRLCVEVSNDELDTPSPMPRIEGPSDWQGDAWDEAANRHLLAHIARSLAENPKCYGRGPSYGAMKDKTRLADKVLDASPEFVQNVKVLVAYKNAWAQDMRDEAVEGEVAVERQKLTWAQCMKRALAQIAGRAA